MENIKLENKSLKSELGKITVKKYNSNKKECDVTNDKENNSKLLLYSSSTKTKPMKKNPYSNEDKTVNLHKINRLKIQLNLVKMKTR